MNTKMRVSAVRGDYSSFKVPVAQEEGATGWFSSLFQIVSVGPGKGKIISEESGPGSGGWLGGWW